MKHEETIIIGAGQAGLATAYYLQQSGAKFLILDGAREIGEAWNGRWDPLKLFTPAQYNGLPGFPFPAERQTFPTKTEMAGYLKKYAERFKFPILLDTRVTSLRLTNARYEVRTEAESFTCDNLVVATGGHAKPWTPDLHSLLLPNIFQIHSSQYKNPGLIPQGKVLVVGAGTSGVQIALDLSATHKVFLAGRPTFHIPDFIFRYFGSPYWWFIHNILTIKTPMGRKARNGVLTSGAPLISVSMKDVAAAGIARMPHLIAVENGQPKFEDGSVLTVDSVIWATGYKPDFSWIEKMPVDPSGWPGTNRGVSLDWDSLYFVGLVFQFGLTSAIIGGVGRDAQFIAKRIIERRKK
jgi:putative flavoprotein involved in K+ transport